MVITKQAFDYLLDHMLDINKRKLNIISPYSLDYDKYTSMLNFFNAYIRRIGDFLDDAVVEYDGCNSPFVTIGSNVYTEGIGTYDSSVYRIVLPQELDSAKCDHSLKLHCCSNAASKALLFRTSGDTAVFKEDGRIKRCTISKIEYPA